ncbi:hypothetical protein [Paracoccus rhizosphaerae]|uniref:Anti-sigma factor NepR domain-containing protein n=1 Tax=Paracoccus rhizosphaerae TaxID=1133347 RepID=A0ABV6CMM1_9RHOB|nr:hypothetical protein [Paracoccus rhizosphaerae]
MTSDPQNDQPHPELDGLMAELRDRLRSRPIPPRLQELAQELEQALAGRTGGDAADPTNDK